MPEPDGSPIGTTLARRYPQRYELLGVAFSPNPEPCALCGHPTGACTQETHLMAQARQKQQEESQPATGGEGSLDPRVANQAGHQTAEAATSRTALSTAQPSDLVTVDEEVLEVVDLPGGVKGTRLLFHKGQQVPRSSLDAARKASAEVKKSQRAETKQARGGDENK